MLFRLVQSGSSLVDARGFFCPGEMRPGHYFFLTLFATSQGRHLLPDVSLITVTEARSSLTLDNAATPAARAVTPPPGAPPAPSQSPPQSAPTLPAHVFGPSPAPTGSSDRAFVPMSVLQMGTHIKLCGVQCGVFNNDNSVVVSSSGRFRSVGERAVAFALSANVPYVSPGDSIQSADFVAHGADRLRERKNLEQGYNIRHIGHYGSRHWWKE